MRLLITIGLISTIACRTDKSITVQNPAPKADIISHSDGEVVLEGMPTMFVGSVTDANHTPDQLTTIWYVNDEIVCDEVIPNENGETTCELALGLEDTEITLAVRDAENARNDFTIMVSIEPTETPEGQILSPMADGVYYSDQLIEFEALVTDAEDPEQDLLVRWVSSLDGELSNVTATPNNSGEVIGFGNLTEGQHAIQLFVTDTTGKESQESIIIDVGPPNSAPLCEILTPSDGSAGAERSLVTFTGSTSDLDVAPSWLTVAWSSDKDGDLGTSTPNSDGTIGFAYSDLTVDTHTITLSVTDEVGAICTDSIFYTVGTPPSITIDSPLSGSVLNEGEPISFTATVSDAQDQPDSVVLDWVANGTSISTQGATSSGTATFSDSTLTYGSYNLVVTATDSDGLTDSDQMNFTVNGVPSAPVVSINPSTPTTSDGLNVSIDSPSVDPEGLTPTYSYEWQLGGQTQTAYASSALPSSATSKGEQWTVVVTPNDGIVDGIAGTASVAIGNTAPSVGTVLVTPSGTVYNDDVLTCSASVTDPDETPTTSYEWTIGGGVVGSSATLDLSGSGAIPGDTVVCTVIATDADGAMNSNSSSQTVSNRSPSISANISTNGTNQNAELTCVGMATDPDGETPTVTYEWFNGSNSLGNSNPLLLNSSIVSSGDVIDCIATATDAIGGTDTATVSHTVTNTAPVISSVTVTPDPATIGQDDLTCNVTASDADGDSLLYSYEWSDSSGVQQTTTLVADTSDVFLTNGLTEDTWTCEVTPYDGTDYGVPVSDSASTISGCSSLDFDGIDDYVLLGNGSNLLNITNSYTLSLWVYKRNTDTFGLIDLEGSRSTTPSNNSGITLEVMGGDSLFGSYGTGVDQGEITNASSIAPLVSEEWVNITLTRAGDTLSFYLNGQLDSQTTGLPTGNVNYNGSSYETDVYQLGAYMRNGVPRTSFFDGLMSDVKVWNVALNSTEVLQNVQDVVVQSTNLVGHWPLNEGQGTTVIDLSTTQLDGTIVGPVWTNTCPLEDQDGDGLPVWEDCDDTNASITNSGSGATADCAAESCKFILDDGLSTGDGIYWLDPDGNGAFEAYCDMTTDGGGWTLASKFVQTGPIVNIPVNTYDSQFRYNSWIKGENSNVPVSPMPNYSGFTVESIDWSRLLVSSSSYELRQNFFRDSGLQEFDVSYSFVYNGYVLQDDGASAADRAWELSNRQVLVDNTSISWDIPSETVRFWLPFTNGMTSAGYTACGGYEYNSILCNSNTSRRRWGNAGIIGDQHDGQDPAGSWAPHTNTQNSLFDIVYVHQATSIYGITGANMTLLYWLR